MMTIEQSLTRHLTDCGMFDDEAVKIIRRLKSSGLTPGMEDRWKEDVSQYPKALLTTLVIATNRVAEEWIDDNCPRHWARGMFADPTHIEP